MSKKGIAWDTLAAIFCFLFGVALIANIHPDGDGLWFWYSSSMLHGQKIYSDLHLNLQPFFVECTAASLKLFGTSWLAFKVFPALQALVYCAGLLAIVRRIALRTWQRGLLLVAVFGLTMLLPLYRFDDYHMMVRCLQIWIAYLFVVLLGEGAVGERYGVWIACAMGLMCGLATTTRLNDGAGLYAACFMALPFLLRRRRVAALVALSVGTAVGVFGTVLLTGDSIAAWHLQSITRASTIKGGTGPILLSPFSLPYRMAKMALHPSGVVLLVIVAGIFFAYRRYPAVMREGRRLHDRMDYFFAAALLVLSGLWAWEGAQNKANEKLTQLMALLLMALGAWAVWRLARAAWSRSELGAERGWTLLLLPLWSLLGGSLTSGKFFPAYEADCGLLLLLLPLAMPSVLTVAWQRRGVLTVCWLIVLGFLPAKILVPYEWLHFHSDPLFENRTVYRHPVYGPMVIEKDQLAFMLPICEAVHAGGGATTLLSTPYPYANYFCDVPPWHGYVQTWYDTSSKETIDKLDGELDQAPTRWILYQRSEDLWLLHEASLGGKRLVPQRAMDHEMMSKIASDQWTVVERTCFQGADWMLLRTTPPAADEHQGTAADEADRYPICKATDKARWH